MTGTFGGSALDACETPEPKGTLDEIEVDGIIVVAPLLSMAAAVGDGAIQVPVEIIAAGASSTPNVSEGDWSPGRASQLIKEKKVPLAIFDASDHTAVGLIRALAESGIRVPDDVSIVGFDDVEGSDFFLPP
jgi:hypothetical protein